MRTCTPVSVGRLQLQWRQETGLGNHADARRRFRRHRRNRARIPGSLSWWKLEFCSEGEYVFAIGESSASFFYNRSELILAPVNWFRFGVVTQRMRVYPTNDHIERGPLVGFTFKRVDLTTYIFPDEFSPLINRFNTSFVQCEWALGFWRGLRCRVLP